MYLADVNCGKLHWLLFQLLTNLVEIPALTCPSSLYFHAMPATHYRESYSKSTVTTLDDCVKKCYASDFCFSLTYIPLYRPVPDSLEPHTAECRLSYFSTFNCTHKVLVSTYSSSGFPIMVDCLRCPGRGEYVAPQTKTEHGESTVNSVIDSTLGATTIAVAPQTKTEHGESTVNSVIDSTLGATTIAGFGIASTSSTLGPSLSLSTSTRSNELVLSTLQKESVSTDSLTNIIAHSTNQSVLSTDHPSGGMSIDEQTIDLVISTTTVVNIGEETFELLPFTIQTLPQSSESSSAVESALTEIKTTTLPVGQPFHNGPEAPLSLQEFSFSVTEISEPDLLTTPLKFDNFSLTSNASHCAQLCYEVNCSYAMLDIEYLIPGYAWGRCFFNYDNATECQEDSARYKEFEPSRGKRLIISCVQTSQDGPVEHVPKGDAEELTPKQTCTGVLTFEPTVYRADEEFSKYDDNVSTTSVADCVRQCYENGCYKAGYQIVSSNTDVADSDSGKFISPTCFLSYDKDDTAQCSDQSLRFATFTAGASSVGLKCIRCEANQNNQITKGGSRENFDTVTTIHDKSTERPTSAEQAHCRTKVTFVPELAGDFADVKFAENLEVSSASECAVACFSKKCTRAVYGLSANSKGQCMLAFESSTKCSNLEDEKHENETDEYKGDKMVELACVRCQARFQTTPQRAPCQGRFSFNVRRSDSSMLNTSTDRIPVRSYDMCLQQCYQRGCSVAYIAKSEVGLSVCALSFDIEQKVDCSAANTTISETFTDLEASEFRCIHCESTVNTEATFVVQSGELSSQPLALLDTSTFPSSLQPTGFHNESTVNTEATFVVQSGELSSQSITLLETSTFPSSLQPTDFHDGSFVSTKITFTEQAGVPSSHPSISLEPSTLPPSLSPIDFHNECRFTLTFEVLMPDPSREIPFDRKLSKFASSVEECVKFCYELHCSVAGFLPDSNQCIFAFGTNFMPSCSESKHRLSAFNATTPIQIQCISCDDTNALQLKNEVEKIAKISLTPDQTTTNVPSAFQQETAPSSTTSLESTTTSSSTYAGSTSETANVSGTESTIPYSFGEAAESTTSFLIQNAEENYTSSQAGLPSLNETEAVFTSSTAENVEETFLFTTLFTVSPDNQTSITTLPAAASSAEIQPSPESTGLIEEISNFSTSMSVTETAITELENETNPVAVAGIVTNEIIAIPTSTLLVTLWNTNTALVQNATESTSLLTNISELAPAAYSAAGHGTSPSPLFEQGVPVVVQECDGTLKFEAYPVQSNNLKAFTFHMTTSTANHCAKECYRRACKVVVFVPNRGSAFNVTEGDCNMNFVEEWACEPFDDLVSRYDNPQAARMRCFVCEKEPTEESLTSSNITAEQVTTSEISITESQITTSTSLESAVNETEKEATEESLTSSNITAEQVTTSEISITESQITTSTSLESAVNETATQESNISAGPIVRSCEGTVKFTASPVLDNLDITFNTQLTLATLSLSNCVKQCYNRACTAAIFKPFFESSLVPDGGECNLTFSDIDASTTCPPDQTSYNTTATNPELPTLVQCLTCDQGIIVTSPQWSSEYPESTVATSLNTSTAALATTSGEITKVAQSECAANISYSSSFVGIEQISQSNVSMSASNLAQCAEMCYSKKCSSAVFVPAVILKAATGDCQLNFDETIDCPSSSEAVSTESLSRPVKLTCLTCGKGYTALLPVAESTEASNVVVSTSKLEPSQISINTDCKNLVFEAIPPSPSQSISFTGSTSAMSAQECAMKCYKAGCSVAGYTNFGFLNPVPAPCMFAFRDKLCTGQQKVSSHATAGTVQLQCFECSDSLAGQKTEGSSGIVTAGSPYYGSAYLTDVPAVQSDTQKSSSTPYAQTFQSISASVTPSGEIQIQKSI